MILASTEAMDSGTTQYTFFPKIRGNGRFCRLQRGCNNDCCLHGLDWLRCAFHMDHTNLHEGGQAAGTVPFSIEVAEEQKE